jgi:ribulose-5-phosphate 4-epimerase/fuculose-1-phosphate aldolase
MTDIDDLRERLALACRVVGTLGLTKAATGHISARLPGTDRVFIRARGPDELGVRYTTAKEIIEVDLDGKIVDAPKGLLAPSEVFIHSSILKARPEVNAVVHVHPPKIVLFTITNKPLQAIYGAYDPASLRLVTEGIPTYPRSVTVTTPELGAELVRAIGSKTVCLMKGHGITTVDRSIEDAALAAISLNELAVMNYEARLLGTPEEISDEDKAYFAKRSDAGRYAEGSPGKPGERALALWRYYVTLTGTD